MNIQEGMTRLEFELTVRKSSRAEYLGDHKALCRILGDALIYVDTRDYALAPHLMMDGYWESWITIAMMRAITPGMVVVDVGANLGYYSIVMGRGVGKEGRVFSFEPNPAMVTLLKQSLEISGVSPVVTVDERAVYSDTGRILRFYIPDGRPMNAVIADGTVEWPNGQYINVGVTTLDDALPQKVDFIKIDAEGTERHVFLGLAKTIANNPQIRIFVEFNPNRIQYYDPRSFLAEIISLGFQLRIVGFEGEVVPITIEELIAKGEETMLDLAR